jgi:hypothetical protein
MDSRLRGNDKKKALNFNRKRSFLATEDTEFTEFLFFSSVFSAMYKVKGYVY